MPTLTASQSYTTDDPGVEPLQSGGSDADAGVSIRWGITQDTTVNLAINPDFSQVEADAAQLEVNNQFALFFPEKRPFFLEGADYFSSPMRAVFTRTVADPSVGLKVTGKRGDHTYGLFAAEDEVTNLIFPGAFGSDSESLAQSNTSVVGRYSLGFGQSSSVGGLFTGRKGDGYHNYVGGLDARWKISDQHNVRLQYLQSSTEYPDAIAEEFEQPLGSFDGSAAQLNYNFDSRNWFAYARYSDRDEDFRADSGFMPRVNVGTQVAGLGRVWHGEEDDWYSRIRLNGDWDITHDDEGRMLEREVEAYLNVHGPLQSRISVGALTRDRLFDDILFKEDQVSAFAEFQPRGGLNLGIWARVGEQVDFANSRLGLSLIHI